MKTSNYIVQVIEPSEGWLTQIKDCEIQERVFSKKIYLSVLDSSSNWKEITEEEYQNYQLELEELNKTIDLNN